MTGGADFGSALLGAVALLLVIEGLGPFFSPTGWRRMFEHALQLTDRQLRYCGLGSMLAGLLLLVLFWP